MEKREKKQTKAKEKDYFCGMNEMQEKQIKRNPGQTDRAVAIWLSIGVIMVFFQVVNLPVEFNASSRAKRQLVDLGIIQGDELGYVKKVLNAAALTYVAATLQSMLTLLYYISRYSNRR